RGPESRRDPRLGSELSEHEVKRLYERGDQIEGAAGVGGGEGVARGVERGDDGAELAVEPGSERLPRLGAGSDEGSERVWTLAFWSVDDSDQAPVGQRHRVGNGHPRPVQMPGQV